MLCSSGIRAPLDALCAGALSGQHLIDSLYEVCYLVPANLALEDQRRERSADPAQQAVLIFIERFHGIALAKLRGISIEHAQRLVEQIRARVIHGAGTMNRIQALLGVELTGADAPASTPQG